ELGTAAAAARAFFVPRAVDIVASPKRIGDETGDRENAFYFLGRTGRAPATGGLKPIRRSRAASTAAASAAASAAGKPAASVGGGCAVTSGVTSTTGGPLAASVAGACCAKL